jgi:hypothetical protein
VQSLLGGGLAQEEEELQAQTHPNRCLGMCL